MWSLKSRRRPLNTRYSAIPSLASLPASNDWLPEYTDTSHRKMNRVPRVAMKEGMRVVVTISPFTTPSRVHPSSANSSATRGGSGVAT